MILKTASCTTLWLTVGLLALAQPSLQLDQLMQGNDFIGHSPANVTWDDQSRTLYFTWNRERSSVPQHYQTDFTGKSPVRMEVPSVLERLPGNGDWNKTYTRKVYVKHGDLFLKELPSGKVTRLTQTVGDERAPVFAADGQKIFYQYQSDLYSWDLLSGAKEQLTQFVPGKAPADEPAKRPDAQWLEDDQLALFSVLARRKAAADALKDYQEALEPKRPRKIYTNGQQVTNLSASPQGDYVFWRYVKNPSGGTVPTAVTDFVTASGYTGALPARSKVGSPQPTYAFGVFDRVKDTTYLLDVTQIPGIYDKPAFLKDYHNDSLGLYKLQYDKVRDVVVNGPVYNEDGSRFLLDIRSLDAKDRWLMTLDPTTGKLSLLDRQRDEAWIGGPGIGSWKLSTGNCGWLADGVTVWYQSEKTGYSHLYTVVATDTTQKKALTSGNFEVQEASLSHDRKRFYLTTNAVHPGEQHFYHLPVGGGKPEQITTLKGAHQVIVSPDGQQLAFLYSAGNKPWELYVQPNKKGAVAKKVTRSTTEAFEAYPWQDPEVVTFTAADGAKVHARLYKPASAPSGGPAVIFVHGAGYLQNAHHWWSSYYREYMFHHLLVEKGYTVLDIDYRGSAGYGRNWRTGIYRFMGGKDLSDHVDGAAYLVNTHQVDPERIGIYGGSYGGFITLMGMFQSAGTFRSGAALRSVTDWAHYNHGYTVNILNTPVEDPEAYRKSSPIYHAEKLKGRLLMLHGLVDVNVQPQDIIRLSQRLIELGKTGWELALYPIEDHGFVEAESWTDEYRRILELFEETLKP
jgi:dipeptidyl aminopeptidase/acylaminoacyl peptidase